MTILLPFVALVLAVLGFLLGQPPKSTDRPPIARAGAAIAAVLVALYVVHRFAEDPQKLPLYEGLVLGAVVTLIAAWLPRRETIETVYLALGVMAVTAILSLQPRDVRISLLAEIVGFGLAALALADERASMTAVGGSLIAAATVLGSYGGSTPPYVHAGAAIGIGVALLGVFRQAIAKLAPKQVAVTGIVVRLLALGLAYAIGVVYLGLHDVWISMALAVAAGVAVWAAVPTDETTEPGRSALASVLWIGLGTLAFSLARGYGMSLALLIGASVHIVLGERRALATCGPLLGLVMYRLFHQTHLDASRALDLGQHYALIGFAIGAALPMFPERWWATKPANALLQGLGGFLWAGVWMALPFVAVLLLGPKGAVGLVAGAGFSTLFTVAGPAPTLLPLAGAATIGGIACATYDWFGDLTSLSRDDKLHWVFVAVIPLFFVGLVLALLGFKTDRKSETVVSPA